MKLDPCLHPDLFCTSSLPLFRAMCTHTKWAARLANWVQRMVAYSTDHPPSAGLPLVTITSRSVREVSGVKRRKGPRSFPPTGALTTEIKRIHLAVGRLISQDYSVPMCVRIRQGAVRPQHEGPGEAPRGTDHQGGRAAHMPP